MIHYFLRLEEFEGGFIYAYSCQHKKLDGRVKIYADGKAEVIKPCSGEEGYDYAAKVVCRKAYSVMKAGFPEEKNFYCA